jgi:hypothetical protein
MMNDDEEESGSWSNIADIRARKRVKTSGEKLDARGFQSIFDQEYEKLKKEHDSKFDRNRG